jgi:hypothetical protein
MSGMLVVRRCSQERERRGIVTEKKVRHAEPGDAFSCL